MREQVKQVKSVLMKLVDDTSPVIIKGNKVMEA